MEEDEVPFPLVDTRPEKPKEEPACCLPEDGSTCEACGS